MTRHLWPETATLSFFARLNFPVSMYVLGGTNMFAQLLFADMAQVIGLITGIVTTSIVLLAAQMFIVPKPKQQALKAKAPDEPVQSPVKLWQPSGLHQHRQAPTPLDDAIERSWR
jgi:hypothetical protein